METHRRRGIFLRRATKPNRPVTLQQLLVAVQARLPPVIEMDDTAIDAQISENFTGLGQLDDLLRRHRRLPHQVTLPERDRAVVPADLDAQGAGLELPRRAGIGQVLCISAAAMAALTGLGN